MNRVPFVKRTLNLLRGRAKLVFRIYRVLKFLGSRVPTEPLLKDDFRPNVYPPSLRRHLGRPRLLDLTNGRRA